MRAGMCLVGCTKGIDYNPRDFEYPESTIVSISYRRARIIFVI